MITPPCTRTEAGAQTPTAHTHITHRHSSSGPAAALPAALCPARPRPGAPPPAVAPTMAPTAMLKLKRELKVRLPPCAPVPAFPSGSRAGLDLC